MDTYGDDLTAIFAADAEAAPRLALDHLQALIWR